MKKTKLIIHYTYEFDVLGIISSIKFYKLAWSLNHHFKIRLKKAEDLELDIQPGKPSVFGNYFHDTDSDALWLIKNRSIDGSPGYLLPEIQHFDYLIKLNHESQSFASEEILKALKEVPWIEYIAAVEINNLKSKDNLLI